MRNTKQSKPVDRKLYQDARDEVLLKVTIPQYFADNIDHSVDLSQKPNTLCPFHEENTPSFRYKSDGGFWNCFGKCQDGGSVIELHQRKFGIKNHFDALWDLKKRYGKKYNLKFPNFFLTEDNKDISIEQILKKEKETMTMADFLKPSNKTTTNVINKIEREIKRIKFKNKEQYIEQCIRYDNLYVYQTTEYETLNRLFNELKQI